MTAPWTLDLHRPGAELPAGQELRAVEGARARLLPGDVIQVHVALPDRPRADLRWIVDRLRRGLAAVVDLGPVELGADPAVADDTVLTLALDLHHASGGRARIRGRPGLVESFDRIGGLEDRCRTWVDEDPGRRTSLAIAADVEAWAAGRPGVEVRVYEEPELRELGLELLLAVGRASDSSPSRLVVAHYRGGGAPPLMLLGKGVTFDTGGINTKPYESFVSMMKNDMAGAALAWSLFSGLVEAGDPEPLLLVLPTCENAVDGRSMRPGELVRSYRGKTVRIDHTDAEGRLILADALAYAVDTWAPREVLCFATLTTAALISYGPYATPVHFADARWTERLQAAADATGEDLHFFPERVWHYEANRDAEADLRNTAQLPSHANRGAGSRNAAHFLRHFAEVPLVHFDIFASAWNWAGDAPGCGYGATGAPLRTLFRALTSAAS